MAIFGLFKNIGTFNQATPQADSMLSYGTTKIYFWGRIFNAAKNAKSSQTPAQIILNLYISKGIQFVKELDGSFMIVIVDNDTIHITRDHHSVYSQLYYNPTGFSTDVHLLTGVDYGKLTPNSRSLATFLSIGYVPSPHTACKGVGKLPAGCVLTYKDNGYKITNIYKYNPTAKYSGTKSIDDFAYEYGRLHRNAINKRIEGCEDVGMLLSGGYDSGANLAALRQIYNGKVRTFSIGFKGDNWSELPLAHCMSKAFDTEHHEYEITGKEIVDLPKIVDFLGDPFVEGGLMVNYCAMKMIGDNKPQVILGGDGSDQYFGTSGREIAINFLISKYGLKKALHLILSFLSNSSYENGGKFYRLRFHLDKILNILAGDRFGFPKFLLNDILSDNKTALPYFLNEKDNAKSWEELYNLHAEVSDLNKVINQVIIFKAARMSEMFGNNLTFPYMDNELFQFLQTVPVNYKCHGDSVSAIAKGHATAKYLLKYHYKPLLPKEITSKKKQGGFAPMPLFFNDDVIRNNIADFILSSSICGDFLNKKEIEKFILKYNKEYRDTSKWFWYRQNKAIQYFNLLSLSIWWEQVINRKKVTLI